MSDSESKAALATLSGHYIAEVRAAMTLSAHVAALAVELAQANGQPVTRPLSRESLHEALEVMRDEANTVVELMWERWTERHAKGDLPPQAGAKSHADVEEDERVRREDESARKEQRDRLARESAEQMERLKRTLGR